MSDATRRVFANRANPIFITGFVAALAASMGGCGGTKGKLAVRGEPTLEQQARLATTNIDPNGVTGEFDANYFSSRGTEVQLPTRWVSEAHGSVAEIEARRAAAQGGFVTAQANEQEGFSAADNQMQRAFSDREIASASADRMRAVNEARGFEFGEEIVSHEIIADAEIDRRERLLTASVREWQAEVERMRSQAESDWNAALSEHDSMLVQRAAVFQRGQATIDQMTATAEQTAQRAGERVNELRTRAGTLTTQTQAQVAELNNRIQTVLEQSTAQHQELTRRARAEEERSAATVAQMLAEAESLESQKANEKFGLAVMSARVGHDNALTDAEQLRRQAQEKFDSDAAEVERKRSEIDREYSNALTAYEEAMANIDADFEKANAEASTFFAEADRVEATGRANFIKAEIDARVRAVREQAAHNVELSETQFKQIRAEAEAEAKRAQAELSAALAKQFGAGSTALPGNEIQPEPNATKGDKTPKMAKAGKKPKIVEPAHVSAFRVALAEASKIRQHGEAAESEAIASRDQEVAEFDAWWRGKEATFASWHARVDAFERQCIAATDELYAQADAIVAAANADRKHNEVGAETDRRTTLARIDTLRSSAQAEAKRSSATVSQLMAQAESTRRNGESEAEALRVTRDSTLRRGTAQAEAYLAQADSIEQSQRAVVAQMYEEINANQQILAAEIQRMDQTAASFIAIAEANYDENVALANTFERITVANASELTAAHFAARKQAEAEIDHLRTIRESELALGNAQVDRFIADAEAALAFEQARDIADRGRITAQRRIADAGSNESLAIASADEQAINARFNHRVASTEADRNRAYAQLYVAGQQQAKQAERAMAEARALKESSNAALARLEQAANAFQNAANVNWDSRLAQPTPMPTLPATAELYENGKVLFPKSDFDTFGYDNDDSWVVVPTDE